MNYGAIGELAIGDFGSGGDLKPLSIASAEAFGTPGLVVTDCILSLTAIPDVAAFGTGSVEAQVDATGIASAGAVGAGTWMAPQVLYTPVSPVLNTSKGMIMLVGNTITVLSWDWDDDTIINWDNNLVVELG